MTASTLMGPVQPPLSGGPPRQLVVLLHGVGADGNDLIALAPFLAQALPEAEFVAPDAPFHYDLAPIGHQWFSLMDRSPSAIANGVRIAAPILDAFLDAELRRRGLEDSDLALVGFSQGTMMALHVAPRRPRPCAAILGYSGALISPEDLIGEVVSQPPVLLIHGEQDDVLPPDYMPVAAAALEAAGCRVRSHLQPMLAHGIDEAGLELGAAFLAEALRTPL